MTFFKLIQRSILYYRRINLGVLATVIFGTAVLVGAMLVGDSVHYSLARLVNVRLGNTQLALIANDRFFNADLAQKLGAELNVPVAPVLQVQGLIVNPDNNKRVNRVNVYGVGVEFSEMYRRLRFSVTTRARILHSLGFSTTTKVPITPDVLYHTKGLDPYCVLNKPVAEDLGIESIDQDLGMKNRGDVVIRLAKPGVVPRDVPVTGDTDASIGIRLPIRSIADQEHFGWFSLQANQAAPLNVFVPLQLLSDRLEIAGNTEEQGKANPYANMLLVGGDVSLEQAQQALAKVVTLDDVGLSIRRLPDIGMLELRSRRVFIDDPLAHVTAQAGNDAVPILTYFVNELRHADTATPYSMVAALPPGGPYSDILPPGMPDDRIVINQWLADDLNAKSRDRITMTYFVVGPNRELLEQSDTFTVEKIVPLQGLAADPTLMPDFPGLSDTENCRDWKPGIEIDLDKIRDKDETYWDDHKGTPKAFITLAAGQRLWKNRFGGLTAVRFPAASNAIEQLAQNLRSRIDPKTVGLAFIPIRQLNEKAGKGSSDFGSLFLGLSMFLIGSAIVLLALVFIFGVERRLNQAGMFLAVGFTRKQVRHLFLAEGLILSVIGACLGSLAGMTYTRLMIWGLATIWSDAVAGSTIRFHATAASVIGGAVAGIVISLLAVWFALRSTLKRHASQLMTGSTQTDTLARIARRGRVSLIISLVSFLSVAVLLLAMGRGQSSSAAGAFFGAGALLLIAGFALGARFLGAAQIRKAHSLNSIARLAARNMTRRRGRSLAVIILLACGVFMVVAVGANRKNPKQGLDSRDSGTGGFALYGETAIGLVHDLNTQKGRSEFGLTDEDMEGVRVVGMRLREGDDASCFNLNRAQQPKLFGVDYKQLSDRKAFRFQSLLERQKDLHDIYQDMLPWNQSSKKEVNGWVYLNVPDPFQRSRTVTYSNIVPAVGDYPTVYWALGKRLGDDIEYIDEDGRPFKVRIVGMLTGSILQGGLLISEKAFIERFPSVAGDRVFLIDAPKDRADALADKLTLTLRDYGLELTPAWKRLAAFHTVENTYLSIFQLLGGLGLAVGSVGLGLVVLVNILERRSELAMLRAVGFEKSVVARMLILEHLLLMVAAVVWGVLSAVVAVLPAIRTAGSHVPIAFLAVMIAVIVASGLLWIVVATRAGLRGNLLSALRTE
ncbi:MAG: ABC transporter permease [Sedimentisphaerales bacterium]|nr:ABC transporter permease [Sedimentisphaerales bacterium]